MAVAFKATNSIVNPGTTIAVPTHAPGDLLLVIAVNQTTNTAPSVPATGATVPAYVTVSAATGQNNTAVTIAYAVATSSSHTSGTWTNATRIYIVSFTGQSQGYPIGGWVETGSTTQTQMTAPEITMLDTTGQSAILHLLVKVGGTTSWTTTPPSGYTYRTTGSTGRLLTKDSTTTDGSVSVDVTSSAVTAYRGVSVEILPARNTFAFI